MKKVLIIAALLFAVNTSFSQTDSEYKKAVVRYLTVSNSMGTFKVYFKKLYDSMKKMNPKISQETWQKVEDAVMSISDDEYADFIAEVYAPIFSAAELNKISDFYDSPVGKKYTSNMPQLIDGAEKGAKKLIQKALDKMKEEEKSDD